MAGESYSPNMNLVLPGVGVTAGPVYASDLNQSLNILDQHNHSAGSGVQITPDGLNINADFTMNNNNIIAIKSLRLQDQVSALSGGSDLGCMYRVGDDLYYNDGLGNQIRITQSGSIAGASGSIANLVSPASATFVNLSSTIVFQSAVNTAASLDAGSILLRNITANSKALTLSPPAAMGSDFSITLPSLPNAQKIMTLDSSGNMSAPYVVDNSTIEVNSNTIRVKDAGITYAKMGTANYSTATITAATITPSFSSEESIPLNSTVSITTTGRPVDLSFFQTSSGAAAYFQMYSISPSSPPISAFELVIKRNGTEIQRFRVGNSIEGSTTPAGLDGQMFVIVPASAFSCKDFPPAGTHTYTLFLDGESGSYPFSRIYYSNMSFAAIGL